MPAPKTFDSLVNRGPECWEWTGNRSVSGYGVYRKRLAHRRSWEAAFGPIPAGLDVLHACDNRLCVRPSHLMVGTRHANTVDAARKGRLAKSRRTHCLRGHAYVEGNIYLHPKKGTQNCVTCRRELGRARRAESAA